MLEVTREVQACVERDAAVVALERTLGMGASTITVDAEVTVAVEAREVVAALDDAAASNDPVARALADLAAGALDLADRWDRGVAPRAEVRARVEALRRGYADLEGAL